MQFFRKSLSRCSHSIIIFRTVCLAWKLKCTADERNQKILTKTRWININIDHLLFSNRSHIWSVPELVQQNRHHEQLSSPIRVALLRYLLRNNSNRQAMTPALSKNISNPSGVALLHVNSGSYNFVVSEQYAQQSIHQIYEKLHSKGTSDAGLQHVVLTDSIKCILHIKIDESTCLTIKQHMWLLHNHIWLLPPCYVSFSSWSSHKFTHY